MLRQGDTGDWIGTFEGHNGAVWGAALNKPALLAATGSADFSAKVWDACTGDLLASHEHPHIVRSVAFGHDPAIFATGCQDKKIRTFDASRPEMGATLTVEGCPASVRALEWLPDGDLVVACFVDKSGIAIYDARSGSKAAEVATDKAVTSLQVLPDGRFVTAEASGAAVRQLGKTEPLRTYAVTDYGCEAAALSVEADRLVCGGSDMWAHVYDATSGEELAVLKGHHGPVRSTAWAPGGGCFATGSEDGTVRLWPTPGV